MSITKNRQLGFRPSLTNSKKLPMDARARPSFKAFTKKTQKILEPFYFTFKKKLLFQEKTRSIIYISLYYKGMKLVLHNSHPILNISKIKTNTII